MAPPCQEPFAIIRTGNPRARVRLLKQHGSEDSSMQFRRHLWHDDPTLRQEEVDDDDDDPDDDVDDEDDAEDDDLDDDLDDDDDDDDFDEDDDGFDADTTEGERSEEHTSELQSPVH